MCIEILKFKTVTQFDNVVTVMLEHKKFQFTLIGFHNIVSLLTSKSLLNKILFLPLEKNTDYKYFFEIGVMKFSVHAR